jgi:hypothetical protein
LEANPIKKELAEVTPHNQRVVGVAQALEILKLQVGGRLAPSGISVTEDNGKKYLSLRWRQDINSNWLKAPTLYLDAVDIGTFQIAKAWLPDLVLEVEARAKASHMQVTQLVDTSMAYRKFSALVEDEEATARNNRDKWANVIVSRGATGLVICQKQLRVAWEKEKSLPPGRMVWNFGAIRGRDEARGVPILVIVSRPQPRPAEVEIMAETIFGRRVERMPEGSWYPKQPVGRLLADGTGRRALAPRHPDPLVEAVRFAVCEGEVLQAVGRGRGIQRTVETPLKVWILTDVPIPIPVDQLIDSRTIGDAGPLDVLAARGIIPLDYIGIAAALSDWFESASKVKNWLEHRLEIRSKLKRLGLLARDGDVDVCELCGISHKESNMGDSAQLAAYSYRRSGARQSNVVLVNVAAHAAPAPLLRRFSARWKPCKPLSKRRRSKPWRSSGDALTSAIPWPFGPQWAQIVGQPGRPRTEILQSDRFRTVVRLPLVGGAAQNVDDA